MIDKLFTVLNNINKLESKLHGVGVVTSSAG
jgi:hypothetical protein